MRPPCRPRRAGASRRGANRPISRFGEVDAMQGGKLVRAMLAALCAVAAACLGTAAPAADYEDPSGKTLIAAFDLRLVGADGERSWLDGGFGKARYGAHNGGLRVRPHAAEGDLVWTPHLGWAVGATIAAVAQEGQDHPVDLSEAFLSARLEPMGPVRVSAKAGLFWPPVSLEHSGSEWRVTETITPSAINSWIGEEVKVAGAEVNASVPLLGHRLTATAALFGFNDTAGTLIAFRGWALHDEKATAFGKQKLPPLDAFMQSAQAPRTRPIIELDNRPGYYAKLAWSPIAPVHLDVLHYDNRGDPQAVNEYLQWGWRTRFTNVGATIDLAPRTRLTAQGMTGRTIMGYPIDGKPWVDTRFRSAFALVTRTIRGGSVSARAEAFGTRGRGSVTGAEDSENGWAATLAARRNFGQHFSLLAELLHVESKRGARLRDGLSPDQHQTVAQLALRVRL